MYPQKRSPFWYLETRGYMLYMLRESTGVLIFLYLLEWIEHNITKEPLHGVATIIGIVGALGHAISWLWLSALLPPGFKKRGRSGLFVVFLVLWIIASYGLYSLLYV